MSQIPEEHLGSVVGRQAGNPELPGLGMGGTEVHRERRSVSQHVKCLHLPHRLRQVDTIGSQAVGFQGLEHSLCPSPNSLL